MSALQLNKISKYIYLFGLAVLVFFLPLSKSLSTISLAVLGLSWFLNIDYAKKWKRILQAKWLWLVVGFYLLHFIFLLNTSDFDYAWHDIKVKIPLFVIPFIIASMPAIESKELKAIFIVFIVGVLSATVIGTYIYLTSDVDLEFRALSPFVSHIRLSLMVVISCCLMFYFWGKSSVINTVIVLVCVWAICYLVMLQSMTGIVISGAVFLITLLYKLNSKRWSYFLGLAFPLLSIAFTVYIIDEVNELVVPKENPKEFNTKTKLGNNYYHNNESELLENGYYVDRNLCELELRERWNKRSSLDFDGQDNKGQEIRYTLRRYLTSLGLRKDAEGLAKLSNDDIVHIENGHANAHQVSMNPLRKRIQVLIWELYVDQVGKNSDGHSLTMRFEYWKTGLDIISENLWLGVGTGDVQKEFNAMYKKNKSRLSKERQRRAHNQFLTSLISFGVIGLFAFVILLFYPLRNLHHSKDVIGILVLAVLITSMFWEDTIETQVGVTLFVVFYSIFSFKRFETSTN